VLQALRDTLYTILMAIPLAIMVVPPVVMILGNTALVVDGSLPYYLRFTNEQFATRLLIVAFANLLTPLLVAHFATNSHPELKWSTFGICALSFLMPVLGFLGVVYEPDNNKWHTLLSSLMASAILGGCLLYMVWPSVRQYWSEITTN
jgi:hypothetical protein